MDNLKEILIQLKNVGCCGIKISFEDEGALLNEIISMRYLTASVGLELSVKIGGCEAKRDIIDCIDINCENIVAPMIESPFALKKFITSLNKCNYSKKKGFNFETITAYNKLNELTNEFKSVDFVTFGRVDFIGSMNEDTKFLNSQEMYTMVSNVFKKARENNIKCYLGGGITIDTKEFIQNLINKKLLDNFETRYVIFDVNNIDIEKYNNIIHIANTFELEWLKYIHNKYSLLANKDVQRIKMIEERIINNK